MCFVWSKPNLLVGEGVLVGARGTIRMCIFVVLGVCACSSEGASLDLRRSRCFEDGTRRNRLLRQHVRHNLAQHIARLLDVFNFCLSEYFRSSLC